MFKVSENSFLYKLASKGWPTPPKDGCEMLERSVGAGLEKVEPIMIWGGMPILVAMLFATTGLPFIEAGVVELAEDTSKMKTLGISAIYGALAWGALAAVVAPVFFGVRALCRSVKMPTS